MPDSTPSSTDSLPPSATLSAPPEALAWRTNVWLVLATVVSVFYSYASNDETPLFSRASMIHGAQFAGSLLAILLAHEFGHYIAARLHKVDASLPYFIPMPFLSMLGTMGAVIRMRGTIPTRKALLDIGASGPLAGLVLAIPLYLWGAAHSRVIPVPVGAMELGESLALKFFDHLAAPPMPPGTELLLSPVAFGAWGGVLVTMINLVPVGQLDGGHVAYALFGPRQDKFAILVHRSLLAFFFVSVGGFIVRDLQAGLGFTRMEHHIGSSFFWLMWFEVLAVLGALSSADRDDDSGALSSRTRIAAMMVLIGLFAIGHFDFPGVWIAWFLCLGVLLAMELKWGVLRPHRLLDHPSTGAAPLDAGRKAVAILTLVLFALLFMPTPVSM
jgi:membrane-associated protease RseP (regulator of RpoE activity)